MQKKRMGTSVIEVLVVITITAMMMLLLMPLNLPPIIFWGIIGTAIGAMALLRLAIIIQFVMNWWKKWKFPKATALRRAEWRLKQVSLRLEQAKRAKADASPDKLAETEAHLHEIQQELDEAETAFKLASLEAEIEAEEKAAKQ